MGEKGDDVVLGLALDLVDAGDVEGGRPAFLPHRAGGGLGNHAKLGQRVGGVRLDLEPDAKARLRRPDRRHFGPGIARDHVPSPPMARYLISRKSSMPYLEPSRPMPDSFMPPKGATSVEMSPSLMPTMPYSSASATRQTRPRSRA